jgi:hypothetical protein
MLRVVNASPSSSNEEHSRGSAPVGWEKDSKRNTKLARAYRDFESDICDLAHMANLVAGVVEDTLEKDAQDIGEKPMMYYVPEPELVLFSVYHLEKMVRAFKEKYFLALHDRA